jgi:hypothetical protein
MAGLSRAAAAVTGDRPRQRNTVQSVLKRATARSYFGFNCSRFSRPGTPPVLVVSVDVSILLPAWWNAGLNCRAKLAKTMANTSIWSRTRLTIVGWEKARDGHAFLAMSLVRTLSGPS